MEAKIPYLCQNINCSFFNRKSVNIMVPIFVCKTCSHNMDLPKCQKCDNMCMLYSNGTFSHIDGFCSRHAQHRERSPPAPRTRGINYIDDVFCRCPNADCDLSIKPVHAYYVRWRVEDNNNEFFLILCRMCLHKCIDNMEVLIQNIHPICASCDHHIDPIIQKNKIIFKNYCKEHEIKQK